MDLKQKLVSKLSQRLVLTPTLQQAIKLLQLSKLELENLIRQEMAENPLLEEIPQDPIGEEQEREEGKESEGEQEVRLSNGLNEVDWEVYFQDYEDFPKYPRGSLETRELPSFENTLTKSISLEEHLLWQLNLSFIPEKQRRIATYIIGNIDPDGYLKTDIEEIANAAKATKEEVEEALKLVQSFDPVGVGARDLRECLLVQLAALGLSGTKTEEIVKDHLELLKGKNHGKIARSLGLSKRELEAHLEIIRRLDPKPGRKYSSFEPHYIVPDIFVVKSGDDYVVFLNEEGLPRLRISPFYRRLLKVKQDVPTQVITYVRDKLRSAVSLLRSFEQRQRSILKVAQAIVKFQREFLDKGPEYLRPMVLADVAEEVGMHESTVSRIVSNKYIHTPQGVFELRYFFQRGLRSDEGSISQSVVKMRIRRMIAEEDPRRPLSDAAIAQSLNKEGITIARRTIAKYREEMGILPSNQRKKEE